MTTYDNLEAIIEFILSERTNGTTDTKIRAKLVLEDALPKLVTAAFKDDRVKVVKAKAAGFAGSFYDWLSTAPRKDDEVKAYILGMGEYGDTSNNTKKHLSHYAGIAKMASAIWEQVGAEAEPEQEQEQDDNAEAIKKAYRDLEEEMGRARPRKSKVHPDKVKYLNDEALTEAYTQAFQDLNGTTSRRRAA